MHTSPCLEDINTEEELSGDMHAFKAAQTYNILHAASNMTHKLNNQ
jgi:hypothetical protein